MKNRRIVVGIISIAVTVILGIFLFNHPDFIKVMINEHEAAILTPTENFLKNTLISIFCGGTIYTIFYGIPHEYKKAKQKEADE